MSWKTEVKNIMYLRVWDDVAPNNCTEVTVASALFKRLRFEEINMPLDHTGGFLARPEPAWTGSSRQWWWGDWSRWPGLIRDPSLSRVYICMLPGLEIMRAWLGGRNIWVCTLEANIDPQECGFSEKEQWREVGNKDCLTQSTVSNHRWMYWSWLCWEFGAQHIWTPFAFNVIYSLRGKHQPLIYQIFPCTVAFWLKSIKAPVYPVKYTKQRINQNLLLNNIICRCSHV